MSQKTQVGVLFGGRSAEHEISLLSAKNIIEALDKDRYQLHLISIDKTGRWYLNTNDDYILHPDDPKQVCLNLVGEDVVLVPGQGRTLRTLGDQARDISLDVIWPVLHGTYGEDGTMQGLLKLADIPFVGPGVLGSSAAMDKDVAKRLLTEAGIPNSKFLSFRRGQRQDIDPAQIGETLGYPCFVKPANLGSSVGIHKVKTPEALATAVDDAFSYDTKILLEAFIQGRELECAVLGNENPKASLAGEVLLHHDFYSYEAKYIDEKGASIQIPVELPPDTLQRLQDMAVHAFQVLECEGMARVDFFLQADGQLLINEINTLPGFTKISMYPKLWGATGVSYNDLLDTLIELAIQRATRDRALKTTRAL